MLAVLFVAGCGSTGLPPADASATLPASSENGSTATRIRSVELVDDAGGIRVEVAAAGPLVWTSYRDEDDHLVVELPNSRPTSAVAGMNLQRGLVESARMEIEENGDRPLTRLVIGTAEPAEHAVRAADGRLLIDLQPSTTARGLGSEMPLGEPQPVAIVAQLEGDSFAAIEEVTLPEPMYAQGTPDAPQEGPRPEGVPATQLQGVEVSTEEGATTVWVLGDGEFFYSTFTLTDPERFVVDLDGVVKTAPLATLPVGGELVERVRVAQFKPQPEMVSRVVIDLSQAASPEVEPTADGLKITFRGATAPATTVADYEAPAAADAPGAALVELGDSEPLPAMDEPAAEVAGYEIGEPRGGLEPMEPMAEAAEPEPMAAAPDEPIAVDEPAVPMPTYDEPELQPVGEPELTEPAAAAFEPSASGAMDEPAEEAMADRGEPLEIRLDDEVEIPRPVATPPSMPPPLPMPAATVAETAPAEQSPPPPPVPQAPVDSGPSDASLFDVAEVGGEGGFDTRALDISQQEWIGEPITMSLKDGDIRDVLRSFAQISGLNMVVQPGVTGTVTVELTDVPWDQALQQVLKINGLDYQLEGNIMRIAPISVLRAEAEEQQKLLAAQALSIPLRTVIRRISYASAGEIARVLRTGGGAAILSRRGSVVVDPRTNTLIIKELPSIINTVIAVIESLDIPEPQVIIEARIIETTKRFSRTLGIEWGLSGIASAATGNTTGLVFPNNGNVDGGVQLLTGGRNGFLDVSLGNVLNTFRLDAVLQAAENEGLINILSAPKIATLNNERATIQSGLQIPIQTIANNTVSIQFINATLRLDVTPHVTAAGTVLMDIDIQKREPQLAFAVAGAQNAPISTKDARTRVIVRDGGTSVIGGIYEVTSDTGEDRVPGLSNVPILKHLFKNKRRTDENEELLIFITPRVIKL